VEIAKKCVETIAKMKAPSNEVFIMILSSSSATSTDREKERIQKEYLVSN
jgi:hypothetical protein